MVAAIARPIVEQVLEDWAIDPHISAREAARRFTKKYGPDLVGERKIVDVVLKAKETAPKEPFPLALWQPWENKEEDPEGTLFVLKLHHLERREGGAGLLIHEAGWARRLQRALEGLDRDWEGQEVAHRQLELIRTYAAREKAGYYLNTPPFTADLDAFISYRMWLSSKQQQRYEEALAKGVVPIPFLGVTEPFRRELLGPDPSKASAEVWDRLDWHPVWQRLKEISEGAPSEGWSEVFLRWLDDPQDYQPAIPAGVKEPVTQA